MQKASYYQKSSLGLCSSLGLLTCALTPTAQAADFYWFGDISNDWNNTVNWSRTDNTLTATSVLPGNGDRVLINKNYLMDSLAYDPVVASNATTVINQLLIGNNNGDAGFLSLSNLQTLQVSNGTTIAEKPNAIGVMQVHGGEAVLGYSVYVGNQGTGELTVENGGKVFIGTKNGLSSGNLMISYNNNNVALTTPDTTKGSVVVQGSGSELHTSDVSGAGIRVGQGGQGMLAVLDGGLVTTNNLAVGHNTSQATGQLTIGSTTSEIARLQSKNYAYIGGSGTGSVFINDKGLLEIKSLLTLGGNQGNQANAMLGKGFITINGGSVKLTDATARTLIGDTTYGEITVQNGGLLESANIRLAVNNNAQGKLTIGGRIAGAVQSAGVLTGAIQFGDAGAKAGNGQLIFDYSDAQWTVNNVISSTAAAALKGSIIQETGSNTIFTNNNDTFTGHTHIKDGLLRLGNGGTTGFLAGTFQIDPLGVLAIDRSNAVNFGQQISGSGQVLQTGTGVTSISTNQTAFTGSVKVANGTLQLGGNTLLGTSTGELTHATHYEVQSTGQLIINRNNAVTLNAALVGSGTFIQNGSGTTSLLLNNQTNFTGNVQVAAGALQLGNGTAVLDKSLEGRVDIATSAELSFQQGLNHLFKGQLAGDGLVRKGQNTILALGRDNSLFDGTVQIDAGTIQAQAANALGNYASYQVGSNGTLDLNGYTATLNDLQNAGHVLLSSTSGTTLTVDTITQSASGQLSIALNGQGQPVISANAITLNGTLNISGFAASNVTPANASDLANSRFLLMQSQSAILSQLGTSNINTLPVTTEDFLTNGRLYLSNDEKQLYLEGLTLAWINGGTQTNRGSFTLTGNSAFNVDVVLADQTDNGAGWNGKTLSKNGSGTLILSANNTYTGGTHINGGAVVIDSDNALGASTGAVTIQNAALQIEDSIVSQRSWTLGHQNSTLQIAAGKTATLQGTMSGSGGLVKSGLGALTLNGSLNYQADTVVEGGTLTFANDTSALTGNLLNAGTVIFDYSGNSRFDGKTLSQGSTGQALKKGSGQLTLNGEQNTLDWHVQEGVLEVHAQEFTGDVHLATQTTLKIDHDLATPARFTGRLQAHALSTLEKTGNGVVEYHYAPLSTLGSVLISAGDLTLSATGTTPSTLSVAGDFTTASGAQTTLSGQNTYLNIAGSLILSNNSKTRIALDLTHPQADIQAESVLLNGTVEVTGFAAERGANTPIQQASALEGIYYTLIRSNTDIQGSFSNDPSINSHLGYLTYRSGVSADKRSYWIDDLQLAWMNGGKAYGTGTFNIEQGTAFDVDVVLADQTLPSGGFLTDAWDGKTLTKLGDGELRLSATHSYTGDTIIRDGILSFGLNDAIANSSGVSMESSAELHLRQHDQIIQSLNGTGTVLLGTATLTIAPANENVQSIYRGRLNGSGHLRIAGNGTVVLQGDTAYTGTTYIDSGHLVLDGQLGGAHLVSNIIGQSGSQLSLTHGAELTGSIDPTNVLIDADSRWVMTDDSLIDDLSLSGSIVIQNNVVPDAPQKRLQVKNWQGNHGTVYMQSFLAGDTSASDRIVLRDNGRVSGQTYLHITGVGGTGAQTGSGILIVDATAPGASTHSEAFSLANSVAAGAYVYRLRYQDAQKQGHNWYLVSQRDPDANDPNPLPPQPELRPELASYSKIPDILQQQGLLALPRFHDRVGTTEAGAQVEPLWARTALQFSKSGTPGYDAFERGQAHSDAQLSVLQIGANWYQTASEKDTMHIGSYAGLNLGRSRMAGIENMAEGGLLATQGYTLGTYAHYQNDTSYWDGILQFTDYPTIDFSAQQGAKNHTDAQQWAASLEAGYRYPLSEAWTLEPQIQAIYQSTHTADLIDAVSKTSYNRHHASFLRTGLRLHYTEDSNSAAWMELNWWDQMHGRTTMKVLDSFDQAPYVLDLQPRKEWLQFSLGGTHQWSPQSAVFIQMDIHQSLKDDHDQALTTKLGFRYTW